MVLRRPRKETRCECSQGAIRRLEQGGFHPREHILSDGRHWAIGPYRQDLDNPHLPPQIDAGPEALHDARGVHDGTSVSVLYGFRRLTILAVVQLPELMLLRGMHDHEYGCEDIYIIVTDMKRQEMDDATEYFKLVCRNTFGRTCKPSIARQIQFERKFSPISSISDSCKRSTIQICD